MLLGLIFPLVCKVLLCLKYSITVILLSRAEKNSSGYFWLKNSTSLPLFHESENRMILYLSPINKNMEPKYNRRMGNYFSLPCMLYGRVPVKKKGWNVGAGPVGELSLCRGTACLDATGENRPLLWGKGGWQTGPFCTSGLMDFGAAIVADGAGSCSAASSAGKSSSLLHDVGVRMLSTWVADEQGLVSHWEAEEVEALSFWDSAKLPGMLSSV